MKRIVLILLLFICKISLSQCTPTLTLVPTSLPCPQNNYSIYANAQNVGSSPSYEWSKNNIVIYSGASNIYPEPSSTLFQNDVVKCTVTRSEPCSTPSATATFTINYGISPGRNILLTANPAGTVQPGTDVTFSVNLGGQRLLYTYQFFVNNVAKFTGQTGSAVFSYTTNALLNGDEVYATVRRNPATNPCNVLDTTTSIIISVQTILPISLSGFSITPTKSAFLLNWKTEGEANSAFFNVQESFDGSNFKTIGKVIAKGNSSGAQEYTFEYQPAEKPRNIHYFRLQLVDKDGAFSYSSIERSKLKANIYIEITPNPIKDVLYVMGSDLRYISVVNLEGRSVLQRSLTQNIATLDVSFLPRGLFLIKVIDSKGQTDTRKIVLQ